MSSRTLNRILTVILCLIGLALYLNIGWALGTWMHNHVFTKTPETSWEKVMSGGFDIVGHISKKSLLADQATIMFLWPSLLLIFAVSWFVYGIYLTFWFMFVGGLAKLLGLG